MEKITAEDFRQAVSLDPAWASKLDRPVEVTDYCKMNESNITHLSPYLHFTGRDKTGEVADFRFCPKLKVAEGNFDGFVTFTESGIEEIGDLTITNTSHLGEAASFFDCENLRIARGKYPGHVDFSHCKGLEDIADLEVTGSDDWGACASFIKCDGLIVARGKYQGSANFTESGIEAFEDFEMAASGKSAIRVCMKGTPIIHADPDEVFDAVFGNLSLPELREAAKAIDEYEDEVHHTKEVELTKLLKTRLVQKERELAKDLLKPKGSPLELP